MITATYNNKKHGPTLPLILKFSIVIILNCHYFCVICLSTFVLNEVPNLHVWITVSSLASRNPSNNNDNEYLVRQVELNWINAPLEDQQDYVALYLDSEPSHDTLPVFKHLINNQVHGMIETGYYLPQFDFSYLYNSTNSHNSNNIMLDDDQSDNYNRFHNPLALINDLTRDSQVSIHSGSQINRINNQYSSSSLITGQRNHANINKRKLPLQDECLGYCLAYLSKDKILARNCFKTNANWMSDIYSFIASKSLPTIMVPGTHNSGTYQSYFDKSQLNLISKYKITQDESIFNQLVYGIRHLDLRVGYTDNIKGRHERFWIYHDIFRTDVSVDEVCRQVRQFLDMTTHEVIIMDFHRFTIGFQNERPATIKERHELLAKLIIDNLGDYIIPSYLGYHAPISEFVQDGKRLLIGYANKNSLFGSSQQLLAASTQKPPTTLSRQLQTDYTTDYNSNLDSGKLDIIASPLNYNDAMKANTKSLDHASMLMNKQLHQSYSTATGGDLFFPPVWHLWPNKDTVSGLAQYMNETTCRKYFGELRSMMAELTATVFGIITDKYNGNRHLAQLVNRPVTDWIRDRWWHCINIVSTDYFLGNDLIRLAIHANRLRVTRHNTNPNHYRCMSFRKIEHLLSQDGNIITKHYAAGTDESPLVSRRSAVNPLLDIGLFNNNDNTNNNNNYNQNSNSKTDTSDYEAPDSTEPVMIQTRSAINHVFRPHDVKRFQQQHSTTNTGSPNTGGSFVDDLTDGFTNLIVSFKRLFNL